jgi:hypothetical protein
MAREARNLIPQAGSYKASWRNNLLWLAQLIESRMTGWSENNNLQSIWKAPAVLQLDVQSLSLSGGSEGNNKIPKSLGCEAWALTTKRRRSLTHTITDVDICKGVLTDGSCKAMKWAVGIFIGLYMLLSRSVGVREADKTLSSTAGRTHAYRVQISAQKPVSLIRYFMFFLSQSLKIPK